MDLEYFTIKHFKLVFIISTTISNVHHYSCSHVPYYKYYNRHLMYNSKFNSYNNKKYYYFDCRQIIYFFIYIVFLSYKSLYIYIWTPIIFYNIFPIFWSLHSSHTELMYNNLDSLITFWFWPFTFFYLLGLASIINHVLLIY